MSDAVDFEKVACEAAKVAGRLVKERFHQSEPIQVETKGLHDFVTRVDREAEEAISGWLLDRFPDHAIMAEEGSPRQEAADFRWIVDPLDGTTNFAHGFPCFAVSIALEVEEDLVLGIVLDPYTGELFEAVKGKGRRGILKACVVHHFFSLLCGLISSRSVQPPGKFIPR